MGSFTQDDEPYADVYIFGYGSLMYPEGINRNLSLDYKKEDLTLTRLNGYERDLNVCYNGDAYFGIRKKEGASIKGAIFPVSGYELKLIDWCERLGYYYDRIDVTDEIIFLKDKDIKYHIKIWTYIPVIDSNYNPPHLGYIISVKEGVINTWGKKTFKKEFRQFDF